MRIRRLFGPTVILQEWDQVLTEEQQQQQQQPPPLNDTVGGGQPYPYPYPHPQRPTQHANHHEEENASSEYWELFIDLLLVAAASSIAETFKESHNVSQFILSYMLIINGWFLYSFHIATRFENSSFGTSLVLFVYLVGFGWTIANIRDFSEFTNVNDDNNNNDNDAVKEFIVGATILRVSVLVMIGGIAASLPRARYFCKVQTVVIASSMTGFLIAFIGTTQRKRVKMIQRGLWLAATTEFFCEHVASRTIDISKFIPLNIEQSQERFNALGLVMLGETVVSITQTFRELVTQTEDNGVHRAITNDSNSDTPSTAYDVKNEYYIVLIFSLLLIFMMSLNLFHTTPPVADHALRRSRVIAVTLLTVHKSIGISLLAVGVSVKLIVEAVMKQEDLSLFGYQCMSFGVGTTLILNLCIRLLHHAGRSQLRLGNHMYVFGVNQKMDRIAMTWWYTLAILSCIPFIWYYFGTTTHDPIATTKYHACLVFAICFIESTYTHILLDMVPSQTTTSIAPIENSSDTISVRGEQQPLL